jgi:hypothetical protein
LGDINYLSKSGATVAGWAKERFMDLYLCYFIDRASARAAIAPGPLGAARDFTSVLGARRGVTRGERDWKIDS